MGRANKEEIRLHRRRLHEEIEALGEELRGRELPRLTEEMFSLYEKTGNRLAYENVYFERRKFLTVYGLLSLWDGKAEDIAKLEEVMEDIGREETWALPAHVDRREKEWRRTVDLFAAETGQTLAQLIYLLRGKISGELGEKTGELVKYRLLDSYMEKPRGSWRWEHFYNNWVAVCAGCLGSMALYLLEDEPQRQRAVLDRVCLTLPDYLDGMYEDGTCPEGLSYFTYGMVYYTGFARQLLEKTGGRVNLLSSLKVCRIARFQQKCYLAGGATISFSDGSRRDRYRLGLTCFLAGQAERVEIPEISSAMTFEDDHCYRFLANYQDDVWVKEYLERTHRECSEPEAFTLLPSAQWAVWKTEDTGVAFKGGHNGEPHNHNDVGSFLFTAGGECFLTDLGCGEYTRDYFAPESRYGILCNRSLGHSVPVVNGQEQRAGEEYRSERFVRNGDGSVQLVFGAAYGRQYVRMLDRRLKFDAGNRRLWVEDMAEGLGPEGVFEENLVTQLKPRIEEGRIWLRGEKGDLEISIPEGAGPIRPESAIFRNHRGEDEQVWLLRWRVPVCGEKCRCVMRCSYVPRGDSGEAK